MLDVDQFPELPTSEYISGMLQIYSLPDPWLRIWALHLSQTTTMTPAEACAHVGNQLWQEDVLRWSDVASDDLRATWRGEGLHAAWFDLQLALHDLKRAVWQAIPQPVRNFYTRHERILYPCAAVLLLVLWLIGVFGPELLNGGN